MCLSTGYIFEPLCLYTHNHHIIDLRALPLFFGSWLPYLFVYPPVARPALHQAYHLPSVAFGTQEIPPNLMNPLDRLHPKLAC